MIICILFNVILPEFQLIVTRLAERLQRAAPTVTMEETANGQVRCATSTGTMEESVDEHDGGARERSSLQEDDKRENIRLKVEHLDFRNDENRTPLHLAAMSGNVE